MSERVGSGIKRVRILNEVKSLSSQTRFGPDLFPNHSGLGRDSGLDLPRSDPESLKFRVVLCGIQPLPTLFSKIKWFWSELPLKNSSTKAHSTNSIVNFGKKCFFFFASKIHLLVYLATTFGLGSWPSSTTSFDFLIVELSNCIMLLKLN